jgi:hypothetical protein
MITAMPKCLIPDCEREARRMFCSQEHAKLYHNRRRDKKKPVPVVCAGCGQPFEGRPDAKTCSSKCRSRVSRGSHLVPSKRSTRATKH